MIKNKLLTALLILVFFKGLVWGFITPIFQSPDENVHYGMIQYLGENNRHPGTKNGQIVSQELIQVGNIVNFNWMASHPVWQGLERNWIDKINQLDSGLKKQFTDKVKQGGQKLPGLYYWCLYPVYKLFQNSNFFIRFFILRFVSVILSILIVYL